MSDLEIRMVAAKEVAMGNRAEETTTNRKFILCHFESSPRCEDQTVCRLPTRDE